MRRKTTEGKEKGNYRGRGDGWEKRSASGASAAGRRRGSG
jgi:hypothetical protein